MENNAEDLAKQNKFTPEQIAADNEEFRNLLKTKVTKETIDKLIDEMTTLHDSKNFHYQGCWRQGGTPILSDQLMRKINRFVAIRNGDKGGEPPQETLVDMANYCIMLIILMKENGEEKFQRCPTCGHLK